VNDLDQLIAEIEADAGARRPRFFLLQELIQHPALLRPPPVVLPRLAYAGRSTLLAGREKSGKSTLLGQAAACLTTGQSFLDEPLAPGNVLWLCLDEPKGDLVRRLVGYGATEGVVSCEERPSFPELEDAINEYMVRLVVVDALMNFASGLVQTPSQPTEWVPIFEGLNGILRRTGAAAVITHHTDKAGRGYADSRQIGASVDLILEMTKHDTDKTVRKVAAAGRVRVSDFSMRYVEPWYQLEDGELTVEMKVYRAIESNPGIGTVKLRAAVGGNASEVDTAVRGLTRSLAIEDRGDGKVHRYHVRPLSVQSGPGQPSRQPSPENAKSFETADRQPSDSLLDRPPCPPPYRGVGGQGSGGQIPECSFHNIPQRKTSRGMYRCPECSPDNRWAA
jgi:hypothetical protein